MNREIKFRVWDEEFEEMKDPDMNLADWADLNSRFKYADNEIFMQYTGLKDKNGVEIYEGDILAELFFNTPYLVDMNPHKNFYYWVAILGYSTKDLEVIGNAWENPKLLERINAID